MSSSVQIANLALTKLGEPNPLLALTDDTNAGRVMSRIYNLVRDAELRRNHWKFSILRTSLTALTSTPLWGYQYEYPLPSDFLGLVQVGQYYVQPFDKQYPMWTVERGTTGLAVMSNMPAPLYIRYKQRPEDSSAFDPLFVELMACKLAYEACEQITGSNAKRVTMGEAYTFALTEAKRADSIENPPDQLPWGTWLESREGYGAGLYGGEASGYLSGIGYTVL